MGVVSGDSVSVTGRFFTHAVATDPNSAVNGTPSGTLTFSGSLSALGLLGTGETGMIFDVGAGTSKASFTNFGMTGTLASSGTDPFPARLTVIKHVVNDNGGTASASSFTMDVGVCSFPGLEAPGALLTLKPPVSYLVAEGGPAGYAATFAGDCSGSLASYDIRNCTVTNDDTGPIGTPTPTPTPTPTQPASPTPTPTPTPGGVVTFSDDFNRGNSMTIGSGWVEVSGDLNIVNQHLENATVVGDHAAARPNLVGSIQTVSADFTPTSTNLAPIFGLILRCQDCGTPGVAPRNYYRVYRTTGGSSLLKISKVVAGVETVLKTASIPNPTAGVPFHLQATASNAILTVAVGAVQTGVTDTGATYASGSVGLLIHSGGTSTYQADNFQATVQ